MREQDKVLPGSVKLDPEKGVNPRGTICPKCRREGPQIMMGVSDHFGICPACKTMNIGLAPGESTCRDCSGKLIEVGPIPADALLPHYCPACAEDIATSKKMVSEGGVIWECRDCHNSGAFGGEHPISLLTRQETNCPSPEPCGVTLDKQNCPVCERGGLN